MLPFDQSLKRKVIVRKHISDEAMVRVYVQGAPEYVLKLCSSSVAGELGGDEKAAIEETVGNMAKRDENFEGGLKVFSYAFKDMEAEVLDEQLANLARIQIPAEDSAIFREEIEKDLTYLGTFGLDDPINADVRKSVEYITYGHPDLKDKQQANGNKNSVNIRMVSGDHIETAKAVAYAAGILDENEGDIDESSAIMLGEDFRASIGAYTEKYDAT